MKGLSKEKSFEYSSKELLGVMRFDFYDGGLANQWNPRDLIIKLKFKYRTLDTKILVIKILEDILKKEDLERFKIYNPAHLIFKLKRTEIKDKSLKTFIKDCKLF